MDENGYIKVFPPAGDFEPQFSLTAADHRAATRSDNPRRREHCRNPRPKPTALRLLTQIHTLSPCSKKHPIEIENCLLAHKVVLEAAVVGLKDDRYGEIVAAFVRPKRAIADPDAAIEELRAWVRQKLSNHLVPKHVVFVEGEFPKTGSGKIQKFKLREAGEKFVRELSDQRTKQREAGSSAE